MQAKEESSVHTGYLRLTLPCALASEVLFASHLVRVKLPGLSRAGTSQTFPLFP